MKQFKRLIKKYLLLFVLAFVMLAVGLTLGPQLVKGQQVEDPDVTATVPPINTDGNDNGTVHIDISRRCAPWPNCNGRQLHALTSYAKLYFRYPDGQQVRAWGCEYSGCKSFAEGEETAKNLRFRFKPTDQFEVAIPGCESFISYYNWNSFVGWSSVRNLNWGSGCEPQASIYTGFYIVQATVGFENSPPSPHDGEWFNMKYQAYCSEDPGGNQVGICVTPGSKTNLAGFWAQINEPDAPMALETSDFYDGNGEPCSGADCYDIWTGFGPPCENADIINAKLQWNDADATDSSLPVNTEIFWDLWRSRNGGPWQRLAHLGPDNDPNGNQRGGNGEKRTYNIGDLDILEDDRLVWHWGDIVNNNDPQLWIPWDTINYVFECNDFNNVPTFQTGPGYPFGGVVEPGVDYTIYANIANTGEADSEPAYLIVDNETDGPVINEQDPGPAIPIPDSSRDYYPPDPNNCAGHDPCWWWFFDDDPEHVISAGADTTGSFTFTIDPDAQPEDGPVCFTAYARPQSFDDEENVSEQLCFPIEIPRAPFVSTAFGSIHAGVRFLDEPCFDYTSDSGLIRGNVIETGSKSDYVVSAGGTINNFGSAGVPDSFSLTFGNADVPLGFYGEICRPDIAARHIDEPKGRFKDDNEQFTVNQIPNGENVYDDNDPTQVEVRDVTITGGNVGLGDRKTLVVHGDVLITNNITYVSGGYGSLNDIPSLAIIATGNIHIADNVTQIYGVFVSGSVLDPHSGVEDGIINTCQNDFSHTIFNPAITSTPNACSAQLTVNGALIANNIYFRRTSGDANDPASDASEQINFMPQLFIRPPLGLTGLVNDLRFQGERPPIF